MENMYRVSHRALMRASLTVLLIDDLTGRPVTGSNARAWINGAKPPVKKNDGWYIFLDLAEGDYTLSAEGGTYSKTEIPVKAGKGIETLTVRLCPNRLYRFPPECVRVEGKAEPGAIITLYSKGKQSAAKLLKDVRKGDRSIALFRNGSSVSEGSLYRVMAPGGSGETVKIASVSDESAGEYELCTAFENDYPKIGTAVVPASQTRADESGSFFAAVKCGSDTVITVEARGEALTVKEFDRGDNTVLTVSLLLRPEEG